MCPTIVESSALNGYGFDGNWGASSGGGDTSSSSRLGRDDIDVVSAVVASVAGGEATDAFLVAHLEFSLEEVKSPFGGGSQTKLVGRGR